MSRVLRVLMFLGVGVALGVAGPAAASNESALALLVIPDLQNGLCEVLHERIDMEWHAGKYEKIFPLFYLLTRLDPNDTESYATGGWFLINGILPKLKKKADRDRITACALRFWEEGRDRNPADYSLYWEMGWYWFRKEDYRRALEYFDQAERCPHPANVSVTKAHAYMKLGMKEEALAQWKKIREEFPDRKDIADRFIKQLTNTE